MYKKTCLASLLLFGMNMTFNQIAQAQNAIELSDLQAVEKESNRTNSPSQVIILNTNQTQDQKNKQEAKADGSIDTLRGERLDQEAKNEQELMRKLEESRMEDERTRLQRLFKIREFNRKRAKEMGEDSSFKIGDKDEFAVKVEKKTSIEVTNKEDDLDPAVQAEDLVPLVPTTQTKKIEKERLIVIKNLDIQEPANKKSGSSFSTESYFKTGSRPRNNKDYYFSGNFGMGAYGTANNTSGNLSWGLAVGRKVFDNAYAELSFNRSSYSVNDPRGNTGRDASGNYYSISSNFRDLTQYNVNGVLAYHFYHYQNFSFLGRAGLSYVRRHSEASTIAGFAPEDSNAFDGLLGVGSEFALGPSFAITGGVDYFANLINNVGSDNDPAATRVEKGNYFLLNLGLKFKF